MRERGTDIGPAWLAVGRPARPVHRPADADHGDLLTHQRTPSETTQLHPARTPRIPTATIMSPASNTTTSGHRRSAPRRSPSARDRPRIPSMTIPTRCLVRLIPLTGNPRTALQQTGHITPTGQPAGQPAEFVPIRGSHDRSSVTNARPRGRRGDPRLRRAGGVPYADATAGYVPTEARPEHRRAGPSTEVAVAASSAETPNRGNITQAGNQSRPKGEKS